MDEHPDVAGFPLDKALDVCKSLGFEVDVLITGPVKASIEKGKPRAVRFNRVSKDRGVVTVVFEKP